MRLTYASYLELKNIKHQVIKRYYERMTQPNMFHSISKRKSVSEKNRFIVDKIKHF